MTATEDLIGAKALSVVCFPLENGAFDEGRQTDRQTDRHAGRQTDRQTEKFCV